MSGMKLNVLLYACMYVHYVHLTSKQNTGITSGERYPAKKQKCCMNATNEMLLLYSDQH